MKPLLSVPALYLAMVLSAAVPAYALPFSVGTPTSGERGTLITASLFDGGVTDLEAADLLLVFDSDVFTYAGAAVGSATSGFSLIAGTPVSVAGSRFQVELSMATSGAPVAGLAGSLVEVTFLIKQDAPLGLSRLVFASQALSDYEVAEETGGVTVTQAQAPLPEPASSMLVGLGVFALGWRRRLRWASTREQRREAA